MNNLERVRFTISYTIVYDYNSKNIIIIINGDKIMKKDRIRWIDMAKGMGMFFVILGHLKVTPYVTMWIYTFHMPLFFILSGCVFHGYNVKFKDFFVKRLKSMVVPYFCLGVFIPIFFSFQSYFIDKERNINLYIGFFEDFVIQRRWFTIWFIACLFIVELLFYGIVKFCKNNMAAIVIVSFILGAASMVYFKLGGPTLPWNIDIAFSALPFFAVGYLMFNTKKIYNLFIDKNPTRVLLFIAMLILNLVGAYGSLKLNNQLLDMSSALWGNPVLTCISAFGGSLAVIMFSNWITIKPVEYIGKNSLVYYAWHSRIMIPICGYIYTALGILQGERLFVSIVRAIVSFAIILIVLTICDRIIRNTKLKFMVGIF